MKTYLKLKDNGLKATHLKVETYYSLGGMNYFTYKNEERGYYLSVVPVERGNGMEGFVAFSGVKQLLYAVKRKSKKAEEEAEKLSASCLESLINHVLKKNNLELEESI